MEAGEEPLVFPFRLLQSPEPFGDNPPGDHGEQEKTDQDDLGDRAGLRDQVPDIQVSRGGGQKHRTHGFSYSPDRRGTSVPIVNQPAGPVKVDALTPPEAGC